MRAIGRWFAALAAALLYALKYLLTFSWLRDLIELIRDLIGVTRRRKRLEDHRRRRDPRCIPNRCGAITPDVYRRPDPMIYSQQYLREQGLAVTWDNPDINLYRDGVFVPSNSLEPGTDYEIRATIWNNSTLAPAVGLRIGFSYHDFGIGPQPIAIGDDTVTLPVKGAPGHPAVARTTWTTPEREGHYCIKVQLHWADDANPKNNLGQENTDVKAATSPAVFEFPVRNEAPVGRVLRLEYDSYQIPRPVDCRDKPQEPTKKTSDREHPDLVLAAAFIPPLERNANWTAARARHGPAAHPLPAGWSVEFDHNPLHLTAGESRPVRVTVTPPPGFAGRQRVNVNAMFGTDLVGGVTLTVTAQGG